MWRLLKKIEWTNVNFLKSSLVKWTWEMRVSTHLTKNVHRNTDLTTIAKLAWKNLLTIFCFTILEFCLGCIGWRSRSLLVTVSDTWCYCQVLAGNCYASSKTPPLAGWCLVDQAKSQDWDQLSHEFCLNLPSCRPVWSRNWKLKLLLSVCTPEHMTDILLYCFIRDYLSFPSKFPKLLFFTVWPILNKFIFKI